MNISSKRRPWEKQYKQGNRYNVDSFYQSSEWKKTRKIHLLDNPYCVECLKEGIKTPGEMVDHIQRIKDGGSRTDSANLQTLCNKHHARKSANESNEAQKFKTT